MYQVKSSALGRSDQRCIADYIQREGGSYGNKILYKNIIFFYESFVRKSSRRTFRNALHGEKILLMGKCFVWAWFRQTLCILFNKGEIQYSNCRRLEMATYFLLQVGEIFKSRQSCSSTVPRPVKHRHQRM